MPAVPWLVPVFAPGKEPLPPGWTEEDRQQMKQQKKYQDYMTMGMESCAAKTLIAGGGGESRIRGSALSSLEHLFRNEICYTLGFAIGAFFSLMSASFAYEDPLLRPQAAGALSTTQKASEIFKEMGRGMWRSGKGFAKVGALFAGIECVIESVGGSLSPCMVDWVGLRRVDFSSTGPRMTWSIPSLRVSLPVGFSHGTQGLRLPLGVALLLQHSRL